MLCLSDDTLESVLEPLDGLVAVDLVVGTDGGLASATLGNTLTRTGPISFVSLGVFESWQNL